MAMVTNFMLTVVSIQVELFKRVKCECGAADDEYDDLARTSDPYILFLT